MVFRSPVSPQCISSFAIAAISQFTWDPETRWLACTSVLLCLLNDLRGAVLFDLPSHDHPPARCGINLSIPRTDSIPLCDCTAWHKLLTDPVGMELELEVPLLRTVMLGRESTARPSTPARPCAIRAATILLYDDDIKYDGD